MYCTLLAAIFAGVGGGAVASCFWADWRAIREERREWFMSRRAVTRWDSRGEGEAGAGLGFVVCGGVVVVVGAAVGGGICGTVGAGREEIVAMFLLWGEDRFWWLWEVLLDEVEGWKLCRAEVFLTNVIVHGWYMGFTSRSEFPLGPPSIHMVSCFSLDSTRLNFIWFGWL